MLYLIKLILPIYIVNVLEFPLNHYFNLQSCAENEEEEEEEEGKEKTFEVLNSWILIEVTKNNKIILILKMHMTIHGL